MARTVLVPVILMILVVSITVVCMGAHSTGFNLLFGFDGIAFDQRTPFGMVWSAFLAAVCLLLLLKAESTGKAKIIRCAERALAALRVHGARNNHRKLRRYRTKCHSRYCPHGGVRVLARIDRTVVYTCTRLFLFCLCLCINSALDDAGDPCFRFAQIIPARCARDLI